MPDYDQAPGANIVITASREGSDKPVLGAAIAMEKLRFPVMMQVTDPRINQSASFRTARRIRTTLYCYCTVGRTSLRKTCVVRLLAYFLWGPKVQSLVVWVISG